MNSQSCCCLTLDISPKISTLSRYLVREKNPFMLNRHGEVLAAAPLQCHLFSIATFSSLAHTRSLVPEFCFFSVCVMVSLQAHKMLSVHFSSYKHLPTPFRYWHAVKITIERKYFYVFVRFCSFSVFKCKAFFRMSSDTSMIANHGTLIG